MNGQMDDGQWIGGCMHGLVDKQMNASIYGFGFMN